MKVRLVGGPLHNQWIWVHPKNPRRLVAPVATAPSYMLISMESRTGETVSYEYHVITDIPIEDRQLRGLGQLYCEACLSYDYPWEAVRTCPRVIHRVTIITGGLE